MNGQDEEDKFIPTAAEWEKFQRVMAMMKQLEAATLPHIVTMAGFESHTAGTAMGTGTAIEFGDDILLVTAEHVIDDIEKKFKGVTFSNGHGKPYSRTLSRFRKSKPLDVAFIQIPRPTAPDSAIVPASVRFIAKSSQGADEDLLFIHGFPGEDSRYFTMTKGIHSRPLAYVSNRGTPTWSGFKNDVHIAMAFDPKYCYDALGKEATQPKAGGLSGSALWNMRRKEVGPKWTPADARIVGIVHRWDQDGRCLIATRIEHVLPFLAAGNVP